MTPLNQTEIMIFGGSDIGLNNVYEIFDTQSNENHIIHKIINLRSNSNSCAKFLDNHICAIG